MKGGEKMLKDILNEDLIQVKVSAKSWEEAVILAGEPLVKQNKVTSVYIQSIIEAINEMGPYVVITPGIAFAHSRPDVSVLEDCLSVTTLETPVEFGSELNDPVHTIFTFGSTNSDEHLDLIQDLAMFLAEEANIELLKTFESKKELLEELIKY